MGQLEAFNLKHLIKVVAGAHTSLTLLMGLTVSGPNQNLLTKSFLQMLELLVLFP